MYFCCLFWLVALFVWFCMFRCDLWFAIGICLLPLICVLFVGFGVVICFVGWITFWCFVEFVVFEFLDILGFMVVLLGDSPCGLVVLYLRLVWVCIWFCLMLVCMFDLIGCFWEGFLSMNLVLCFIADLFGLFPDVVVWFCSRCLGLLILFIVVVFVGVFCCLFCLLVCVLVERWFCRFVVVFRLFAIGYFCYLAVLYMFADYCVYCLLGVSCMFVFNSFNYLLCWVLCCLLLFRLYLGG